MGLSRRLPSWYRSCAARAFRPPRRSRFATAAQDACPPADPRGARHAARSATGWRMAARRASKPDVPTQAEIRSLSRPQARRLAERLRAEIRRHDYLYYVLDRPEISDAQYDRLFDALKRIEQRFPDLVTPDSPTQRVAGAPAAQFRTVEHLAPMTSL